MDAVKIGSRNLEVKGKIIEMALNGSGIRDTSRVLDISITTVLSELKKNKILSGT